MAGRGNMEKVLRLYRDIAHLIESLYGEGFIYYLGVFFVANATMGEIEV